MTPYYSTRGGQGASLEEALRQGLAPDKGLYLPATIHQAPDSWRSATSVADLAERLLGPYMPQMTGAVRAALDYPVPVVRLSAGGDTWVAELFHGPTLSFKDFGARTMAALLGRLPFPESMTVLVATSGDTGSAVAEAFSRKSGMRVALLFPSGQVSPTQELQLTVQREEVRTWAVDGTFDDCQAIVKAALACPEELHLTAANSINVGRLLPQMVYYFWAALHVMSRDVTYCVPSGNLGNLTGGVLAVLSGLSARGFIAANNVNGVFARYLATGAPTFGASVRTVSSAMDVGAPSNFERLRHLMPKMRVPIAGYSIEDTSTLDCIRRVYDETGYMADPHTAVGLEAVRRHRKDSGSPGPYVVLATAHPAKFPEVMARALGQVPPVPPALAALADSPRDVRPLRGSRRALLDALRRWDET